MAAPHVCHATDQSEDSPHDHAVPCDDAMVVCDSGAGDVVGAFGACRGVGEGVEGWRGGGVKAEVRDAPHGPRVSFGEEHRSFVTFGLDGF